MLKSIAGVLFLGVTLLLSGCTLPTKDATLSVSNMSGGVIRSDDHGQTYKPVVKVDDKANISGLATLNLTLDKNDTKNIYLGSLANGVFKTTNGGESWVHFTVPIQKNYALVRHPSDSNIAYVTGVYNGRGKIAKTVDGGETWKEIYTEPADGTVLLSLAIDARTPDKVYAGTSSGVIIMTRDGGATWENKFKAQKPVRSLAVDAFDSNIIYAMIFQDALLISRDGGDTFVDMVAEWRNSMEKRRKNSAASIGEMGSNVAALPAVGSVYSYTLDSHTAGSGYVGTNKGLFKFMGYGATFEEINIIASSKVFPITAVAVSPQDSKEVYYSSAQAIYRTMDGGSNWFAFQLDADNASVSTIVLDSQNAGVVYVGLRQGGK